MKVSGGGKISRKWGLSSAHVDGGGDANMGPGGRTHRDWEEGV